MGQRQDAVRNRARLVAAAEEVFRAQGASAPLDLVAVRAGVGRGTLYRHFPDREALIEAVYAMRVDALEAHAGTLPPERLLEHLVVEVAALQLDAPGLLAAVRASRDGVHRLADVARRTRALVADALASARTHGTVRDDVTTDDVLLIFAMVEGVVATEEPERLSASVRRAVEVALRGVLAVDPAPLPEPTLVLPPPG